MGCVWTNITANTHEKSYGRSLNVSFSLTSCDLKSIHSYFKPSYLRRLGLEHTLLPNTNKKSYGASPTALLYINMISVNDIERLNTTLSIGITLIRYFISWVV